MRMRMRKKLNTAQGRPVYMGPSKYCLSYFTQLGFPCPSLKSPADHFLDVMSGTIFHETDENFKTEDLADWWKTRSFSKDDSFKIASSHANPLAVAAGHGGGRDKMQSLCIDSEEARGISEEAGGRPFSPPSRALKAWRFVGGNLAVWTPGMADRFRKPPNDFAVMGFCGFRALKQMFGE